MIAVTRKLEMDQASIRRFVAETYAGVDIVAPDEGVGAGDTFFIYDPERNLDDKQRFPFATIVSKDYGEFDNTSNLNRPGVFRLNIGLSRGTFQSLFPGPTAGDPERDFTALDQLMPHPVYAAQSFVCVLNPSFETFHALRPLLDEAYERASSRSA
jgi:hypothetical protein